MACFDGPGGTLRLIRNHELRNAAGNLALGVPVPEALKYDPKAMGGCMTLDFDPRSKQLVRQFASIGGTFVNCAGGWSWRRTGWITCEETTAGVKSTPAPFDRPHGYCFFVPAAANAAIPAVPLKWLGRFSHEAALADERGIVYQTEDAPGGSGFYRAVPQRRDDLAGGGTLEMLAIKGRPQAGLARGQTVGTALPVEWVRIDASDPDLEAGAASCFNQGRAKGGAAFNRLEGAYLGHDGRSVYFVSTSGGEQQLGQLWHYLPADGNAGDRLVLAFESPAQCVLDSPDNLCVTPSGAILFCEDDANPAPGLAGDTHPLAPGAKDVNRLIGLGPGGEPFEFAVNVLNDGEFAGACFSPDGAVLFVNLFGDATPGSGMTCAIWGPWERGPL
jgi:secreted PhoX family phosphatase